MGDPKFPSKHYNTPSHPWQKTRIEQERTLTHQYGLKSKKEIWKADTKVREMRRQARKLTACLLYTSPSPRDLAVSRMPSSA